MASTSSRNALIETRSFVLETVRWGRFGSCPLTIGDNSLHANITPRRRDYSGRRRPGRTELLSGTFGLCRKARLVYPQRSVMGSTEVRWEMKWRFNQA